MSSQDGKPLLNLSIDDLSQTSAVGNISRAITDNLYGFNHRQTPSPIPINKDHYGLTFFTRPQLNFTTGNLRNIRRMIPLLTEEPMSYQRAIRCLLDPRAMVGYKDFSPMSCPLIDNTQAFIPILTNHLVSISGWQDIVVPTFTSKDGAYKESYSMVDGVTVNYTTYDITATFRNSRGDPITSMFYYWAHYMANVFEGTLMPYPDFVMTNELDYNTRIYRLVLDSSKKYVQRIAATGASFPTGVPIGGIFDYSSEKPYNDVNSEIAIPFRCSGAIYNDDILIYSFNKTVQIFNNQMVDGNRESAMIQIPAQYLTLFNNRGYPRIEPETYELQWWISKASFERKKEAFDATMKSYDLMQGDFSQLP